MYDERTLNLLDADRRLLVRAASRMLGAADAEDAVQDAYVRALEMDGPAFNAAQAWLLTVVRNLAVDRLRRRHWMQQWLTGMHATDTVQTAASAEMDAALAQEAALALQQLAAHLTPADGAALLLHEVFEASHAEIAQARGQSEAGSRQQLRRALLRLRQARGTSGWEPQSELEAPEETVFRLYVQALQLRDPQVLWGMLRQPPVVAVHAQANFSAMAADAEPASPRIACGVMQLGGQLALVLTLDGVRLCVVPLDTSSQSAPSDFAACS